MLEAAIATVIVMAAIGLVFGLVLAVANQKLRVEADPRIEEVDEALPKGQCGACGFAGCAAYAEAVVLNPNVAPNLCVPGKQAVADAVSRITGKTAEQVEPRVAHIRCAGTRDRTKTDYEYTGMRDCAAANLLHLGPKTCKYGCIGFGNCVSVCKFDALEMDENGLPVVNPNTCTGCGSCEKACPKGIIQMLPIGAHVKVSCSSHDKGAIAKKVCSAACIGCGICAKNCPHDAITIVGNLAVVDASVCTSKCVEATCLAKCPTGAIESVLSSAGKASVAMGAAV